MSPSFFEKITGATFSKEEGPKEKKDKNKTKDKISQGKAMAEEKDIIVEKNEEKEKKFSLSKKMTKPEPIIEDKKSEDWLTESEGQLTIDVYQTANEVVIKSTIAGVKPEDIDISMTNDMITIKGSRRKDETVKEEDYYYQECYWGAFSRSVILPVDVESDKAEATMKNGILTIRLPKVEKVKTKKIEIRAE